MNPHPIVTADDDEIQYLGSSSLEDVSEVRAEVNITGQNMTFVKLNILVQLNPTQRTDVNNVTLPMGGTVGGSKRRRVPRMIPFVSLPPRSLSIKREPQSADPEQTQATETQTDDSARSHKRRKVEVTAPPKQARVSNMFML